MMKTTVTQLNLTKIDPTNKEIPREKPRRVIYGGCLCHGMKFQLSQQLYGSSPLVWGRANYEREIEQWRANRSRYYKFTTNERTMIRGSIGDSICEVNIFPVEVVIERPDGSAERWSVTKKE